MPQENSCKRKESVYTGLYLRMSETFNSVTSSRIALFPAACMNFDLCLVHFQRQNVHCSVSHGPAECLWCLQRWLSDWRTCLSFSEGIKASYVPQIQDAVKHPGIFRTFRTQGIFSWHATMVVWVLERSPGLCNLPNLSLSLIIQISIITPQEHRHTALLCITNKHSHLCTSRPHNPATMFIWKSSAYLLNLYVRCSRSENRCVCCKDMCVGKVFTV